MISDESQSSDQLNQDSSNGATEGQDGTPEAQASGDESEQPAAQEAAGETAQPEAQGDQAPSRQRAPRSGGRTSRAQRTTASARAAEEAVPVEAPPKPRLLEMYRATIVPAIMEEFGFTNPMRVPRVQKIVLNIGLGEALTNSRAMDGATGDLTTISGQKPVITRARKSIAGFKIREGNPIGTSVTLRGARMYHFLDRLINMALPRIRDFRGIPRSGFDGRGNFSIGIREQIIFPEIDFNQIDRIRGLQVTIATSALNDEEGIRLLELYGMPFIRQT
jgi:large subunit ribosomal protein L5